MDIIEAIDQDVLKVDLGPQLCRRGLNPEYGERILFEWYIRSYDFEIKVSRC